MMKKITTTVVALGMAATMMTGAFSNSVTEGIFNETAITADAADSSRTKDQAVKWINARASESWAKDVDGSYGCQCVDLVMAYYRYLVGYNVGGNATNYQSNKLPGGWKRTNTPQAGDVIVWGGNTKINANYRLNKYGHVGLVVAVNSKKGTVTTVETRGGSGTAAHKYTREIKYATVFIRPAYKTNDNVIGGALTEASKAVSTASTVTTFKKYTGGSGSIVTALNSIGAKSSFDYRTKIYYANSDLVSKYGKSYRGTAAQNIAMLGKLKKGSLVKP